MPGILDLFFLKNPNFERFENSYYSSRIHSTANLLRFGEKIIYSSDVDKNVDVGVWRERNWQTLGRVNVRNSAFERILLPLFIYGAK